MANSLRNVRNFGVLWALIGLASTLGLSGSAVAQGGPPLVADLSERSISITLGFSGTDLLLFGATDATGEIVVIIRGPSSNVTVRRKDRIGGIWVNNDHVEFKDVPGFYLVASSGPLDEIASPLIRQNKALGFATIPLETTADIDDERRAGFRDALLRNKQRQGLYREAPGSVELQSGRLFRTTVNFPSIVPTGDYTVEVILLRNDRVISATLTPLVVSRTGFESLVFTFAHLHSELYGLIAIVVALMAGWFAGFAFRRF
jgi:uncharacterized protein (TIGR02186 family)